MRLRTLLSAGAAAALLAACSIENQLPKPTVSNVVDTITLGALRSTPVGVASAYSLFLSAPVRTDLSSSYDFLYDLDPVLGPALYPAEATGVFSPATTNPGLQRMTVAFDSIIQARSNGYILDQPLAIDSGAVFLARSPIVCNIGVPQYGKLQILGIDSVAHTVTFQIMVNNNCGYRGLQPGLPSN